MTRQYFNNIKKNMEYAIKLTFQFGHLLNLFTFFQHSDQQFSSTLYLNKLYATSRYPQKWDVKVRDIYWIY